MLTKLAKFMALPTQDRALLSRALLLLPLTVLRLKLFGFRTRDPLLAQTPANSGARDTNEARLARRIASLVATAARHGLVRGNCLSRSLVLQRLLSASDIDSVVRLGARKANHRLEAHAWVEHRGQPLNDPADVINRFPPFEHAPEPGLARPRQ